MLAIQRPDMIDGDRHGPKKVGEYIVRITENGVVEANHNVREVYEYGNSELIRLVSGDIVGALKKHLPDYWESAYALSAVRLIEPVPLKSVMERWEKLYMSMQIKARLSPNTLTGLLRDLGSASHHGLFRELMQDSRKLAFDLSSIFSRSENIVQKGHNADHLHIPQVNMALIFDLDRYRPVFLRPLDGSVRGVKSLRKVLEEVDFNGILMPDWWFKGTKILITAYPKVRKALPASTGTQPLLYQITSSHGWSMCNLLLLSNS